MNKALDYFRKVVVKNFDLRSKLPLIDIPVFIGCGRYDAQCPIDCSEEMATLIPNSVFTIFKYSNHNPYIEELELFEQFVKETLK